MKKVFLVLSCLLSLNSIFSQPKAKEYFLERSKKQNTTAWILLGTGAAAIVTGAIIDNAPRDEQSFTGGFIEIGGILCTLTSIPYFLSSAKNKKRARTLTINNRSILLPQNNSFVLRTQPHISLHFH